MKNGFQGKEGQRVPEMTDEIVASISARYKELFLQMTGSALPEIDYGNLLQRIEGNIVNYIN